MKWSLSFLMFLSLNAQAARFVVEARHVPSMKELTSLKDFKIEPFSSRKDSFFSRSMVVSGNVTKEQLQNISWIAHVEEPVEIQKLSLDPAKTPSRMVVDELFQYQWGLYNGSQVFYREKDDIHNLPLVGVPGQDIGFEKLLAVLPKEKVIVAVLDSGVDLTHPEIQGNLWKNEEECGKNPAIDNDHNKLPGDCHGWNFTEAIDSDAAKSPQDIEGHGTHVAGIIGAAMNGEGIVGVNPNVLIMPIKVMRDVHSTSEIHTSESFARGLVYATDMGASIINMSLGWPRALETKLLREAVYYALSQGVVIVAAAGNNNSSEPLYPCAYDGVVCVGASTLDGNFAGFTNYGSHVDTLAPGEGILSLSPMIYEPDFFSVPGYDLKSGTSQSAPIVAGLISVLRAQNPKISIDEILARIYSVPSKNNGTKYIQGGPATWSSLSAKVETPVIRPILKKVRQLVIQSGRTDGRITLPVRNFGVPAEEEILVTVESLSKGTTCLTGPLALNGLNHAEVKDLSVVLKIEDFNSESNVKLKISFNYSSGKAEDYLHEIPVVRDIRNDPGLKKNNFAFDTSKIPVGIVKNGTVLSLLTTLPSYLPDNKHEFYLKRNTEIDGKSKIELTVIRRIGDKYELAPNKIILDHAFSLVNFLRVDIDGDGLEDYVAQSVIEVDKQKHMQFSFYKSNLEPLWTNFNHARVVIDTSIRSMNDIRFVKIKTDLGTVMVPAFFTEGQIPKNDQVISSWQRLDPNKEKRLYYLEPTLKDRTFKIRSFTTNVWKEKLKESLKSKWFDTVMVEQLLPVSSEDGKNGHLRIFVSVGQGAKRQLLIIKVEGKDLRHGIPLPQLVLQTDQVDSLYKVSSEGLTTSGDVYMNVYDRSRVKVVTTKGQEQAGQFVYKHEALTDIIAGHLVSFENKGNTFSVLQSREELISISGGNKISKRPKLRYSFLSAKVLSEMYNPVIYNRNGVVAPALYVDSTAVTANRINLFEEQDGSLVSSIRNSLTVPPTCKAMNPAWSVAASAHQFVFLCLDESSKEWAVRTFDMK